MQELGNLETFVLSCFRLSHRSVERASESIREEELDELSKLRRAEVARSLRSGPSHSSPQLLQHLQDSITSIQVIFTAENSIKPTQLLTVDTDSLHLGDL